MRRHFRTVVVGLIGAGLMAFVLRGADLGRVADAVRSARLDLIGLAVLAMVATYLARAVRWCYLLEPLGRVHLGVALRATVMGFAATAVLPGRVGEILRPYLLARREQLSVSAAIGDGGAGAVARSRGDPGESSGSRSSCSSRNPASSTADCWRGSMAVRPSPPGSPWRPWDWRARLPQVRRPSAAGWRA